MITLRVQDYCANCPEFEPTVITASIDSPDYMIYDKTIKCEHAQRCAVIYKDAYKKAYKEAKEKLCSTKPQAEK